MAARKTTTRTLRLLRTVLMVSLVGFVLLVFALYRFGRAGLPGSDEFDEAQAADRRGEDTSVMAGEGFDYFITQGEKTLARIRAQRVLSENDSEVTLEAIDPIEVYREDGDVYKVSSDTGTYNFDTQGTTLTGNVLLEGPQGMELRTDGLSMGRSGNSVTSSSPVSFSMAGEFAGTAQRLIARLDRDLFKLSQGVELFSTSPDREPIRLRCKRLTFDRRQGLLHTEGDVEFSRGESWVRADRIVFYVTEDENSIRYISGRWGLRASFVKSFGQSLVRRSSVRADEFSVLLDPDTGEPLEAEILGGRDNGARISMTDETSAVRVIRAPIMQARFQSGELRHVDASDHVQIHEYLEFAPEQSLRWACGKRAEVDFDADGEMHHAILNDRVEFRQGRSLAKGDRVEMSAEPYTVQMVGDPARFIDVQGELTAPRIAQQEEDGEVRATGGVRGRFDPDGGARAISIGGARGPMRVESAEATWDRQTPSFKFIDTVRLWQDENLLLAKEVEALTEEDLVVARGGIRMFLVQPREDDPAGEEDEEVEAETVADDEAAPQGKETEPSEEEEEGEDTAALDDGPVEISSRWMEYGLEAKTLFFHDNVRIQQTGRRMTCNDAEATMAEAGGLESVFCQGRATIEDSVAQRQVTGIEALYLVGSGEITFHGNPVVMTGDQGERVEGATLVYDLGSGTARVERATGPPPAPTRNDNGPDPGNVALDDGE